MKAKLPRLVLFARYPTPGKCKTRLIPAVGAVGSAAIHRYLTERSVKLLRASDARLTVAITGADCSEFKAWLGADIEFEEQVEGGLSEKLLAFLDRSPIIFFGSDTPDLGAQHVKAAIDGLCDRDVVIGPANDGGYYLIGMRSPLPMLLTDMPWSTDQVLPETLRRLEVLGIEPLLLDPLSDCDRPEDLERWPDLMAKTEMCLSQPSGA